MQPLVGVVSCCGECNGFGTLSRIATRLLMEKHRPNCITICLPLFSSGEEGENDFAKRFPTITVDGCVKRCATIATEELSGPVKDHLIVTEVLEEWGISREFSRRCPSEEDIEVADGLALRLAEMVDKIIEEG